MSEEKCCSIPAKDEKCCSTEKECGSGGKCETNVDRLVIRFAGAAVLVGLVLGYLWTPGFYLLTAFVGANLLQASFTGFCPLAKVLKKMGVKDGAAF